MGLLYIYSQLGGIVKEFHNTKLTKFPNKDFIFNE